VPYLVQTVYDSDSRLKSNMIGWCRQQKAIRLSFESADERRLYALSALSELGSLAFSAWVDMITNRFSNPRARGFAYWELQKLGEGARPACPVLLNVYSDADATSRAAIRQILHRCDTNGVLMACLNLQEGEDLIIRAQAARSLGELAARPETAVPALMIALRDSNPWVRQATLEALAQFKARAASAVGAIRPCLIDPEPEVREAATNALEKITVGL